MKELSYSLTLNIAYKNINKASFFIMLLQDSSDSFFLSKKILKKINIINSKLFLQHPIFLKTFLSYKNLSKYFFDLDINSKNLIEYINVQYFQFYQNIQLLFLFNENIILKDFELIFQNGITFCQSKLAVTQYYNQLVH